MNSEPESDDYEETEFYDPQRKVEEQLDEFRNKWKKEIQQRTIYGQVLKEPDNANEEKDSLDSEEQAKQFFRRAADLEHEGKLYDAIKFYRAAMQLVPDIEFRMAPKTSQPTTVNIIPGDRGYQDEDYTSAKENQESNSTEDVPNLLDTLENLNLDENETFTICQKNFPQQATHISSLPSEVLIYVFRWIVSSELDVRSLEQCSRVCRGFYRCSRDPQLWKMICLKVWGSQTGHATTCVNWRHMFIHRPHVVYNGVYISRASYIRQGEQSLDNFYSPWHLVEYYRYFRFFPDGFVFIYTSADEPRQSVVRLKNRYAVRDPSLIYGSYRLTSNRIVIVAHRSAAIDMNQRRTGRDKATSDIDQLMHMEFEICDSGRKRHQQLVWKHYEIKFINKRTGEERPTTIDIDDKHAYPPLIFSRVKSYTVASEQLLK